MSKPHTASTVPARLVALPADPYVYPSTSCLRNRLGIRDLVELERIEAEQTSILTNSSSTPTPARRHLPTPPGVHQTDPRLPLRRRRSARAGGTLPRCQQRRDGSIAPAALASSRTRARADLHSVRSAPPGNITPSDVADLAENAKPTDYGGGDGGELLQIATRPGQRAPSRLGSRRPLP